MNDWLPQALHGPAVLVTVARVEGSVPREPGARMLVDATGFRGTIGGGHLEHRALDMARAMLATGGPAHIERFPLGPKLGQCCGGIAWLVFEVADPNELAMLHRRRNDDTWRTVCVGWAGPPPTRPTSPSAADAPPFDRTLGTHVLEHDGRLWLIDAVLAPRAHLMLFGAGHVGAAIVRALSDLPCRVTWIDERDDLFPSEIPANVTVEATDTPESLVETAPPGTTFLVMTHSHALDLALSHAILSRPGTPDWFGLIGSDTKRRQFEHRLRERGIADDRIDDMVCPIGLPGIEGKAPAVIAASVAAQLLGIWEAASRPPEDSTE